MELTAENGAPKPFVLLTDTARLETRMAPVFDPVTHSAIRTALARENYRDDTLRLVDHDLGAARWLVSTQNGLFALGETRAQLVAHGWFFGLTRRGSRVFMFENCARRDRHLPMGRLVACDVVDGALRNPVVIAKGLDAGCHQIAFIEDVLCVLDTANQCVLRFTDQGLPVEVKRPFPPVRSDDPEGDYLHINAIATLAEGIAVLAHNGKRRSTMASELIYLDRHWHETARTLLPEPGCHDIVRDADGLLWHCASMSGAIICSDGRRVPVAPERMTRGLLFDGEHILVGASVFGERSVRDFLPGSVIMLDRSFNRIADISVDGPPASIIAL